MTTATLTRSHGHSISEVHYWAGASVGIIASLVMGMLVMAGTLIQGRGLFLVPEKIATLVLSDATAATAGGIFAGLGIHMMLGAVFGVFFALGYTLLTSRYDPVSAIALGLVFGFGLWVANFLIIGPAIGAQLTSSVGAEIAIPGHLIFGLALGLYPILIRETQD